MTASVRGSTAFGVAVALAVGVASGWWLGGGEPNDRAVARESWLFSHTADAGEIREAGDGSLELVLRSSDDQVMAFTDRPFREAKIEPVEWLVSLWDELFAGSPPNGVVVEHDPDGTARSVVVELSSPRLSGGELTYAVTVLDALPEGRLSRVAGVLHESPVRSFRAVSVFIDDVSLSCAQGGACAVGDTGPGGGKVFRGPDYECREAAPSNLLGFYTWSDAMQSARSYGGGGRSDWYLPSFEELDLLYQQRDQVGMFSYGDYWSSSEHSEFSENDEAFSRDFNFGFYHHDQKWRAFRVRPIRKCWVYGN